MRLDLSFPIDRRQELTAWPSDLAALMVGVAIRQGESPTAIAQARLSIGAPPAGGERTGSGRGAFNPAVAALLARWANP